MNFKSYACLTAGLLLTASTLGQESQFPVPDGWVVKKLTSGEVEPGPTASFLSTFPEIDGQLDPGLDLPAQNFTLLTKSNALNPEPRAVYRLGYSTRFLYLQVESDGQTLIHRDRGYQNGDGLILVLAHAQPGDVPSDGFYVLGFSAARDSYRKVVWYYNKDLALRRLSDNVLVQTFADGGKVGFELAIPWEELPGYHAFAPYPLGFNLCLVRAIGTEKEKNIFYVSPDPSRAVRAEASPVPAPRL